MMKCSTGKKLYSTKSIAEEVLIELWIKNDFVPGQGPCTVYQCEHCGYYHLTSQGPMNERLAELLGNGYIRRMRTASRWTDRF
jgi:hypothetical protein